MFGIFDTQRDDGARIVKKGEKRTKIVCVDDNKIILSQLTAYVKELYPSADAVGFEIPSEALAFAEDVGCDILFTEIEMYGAPHGIELSRKIKAINPRVNIIFTTVCSQTEYAGEVMELRPSGYLTKVVTKGDVKQALQDLLYAV